MATVDDEGRCRATAKATGERCRRSAIAGGSVCTVHGGRAPQVKAKAARRQVEAKARLALTRLADVELGEVTDPIQVLRQTAAELVAVKGWLYEQVTELQSLESAADDSRIRGTLAAYGAWLDRIDRLTRGWLALGLAERATIGTSDAEALGRRFKDVLDRVVEAGVPAEDLPVVRRLVAALLRAEVAADDGDVAAAGEHRRAADGLVGELRQRREVAQPPAPVRANWEPGEVADAWAAARPVGQLALPPARPVEPGSDEWLPVGDGVEERAARLAAARVVAASAHVGAVVDLAEDDEEPRRPSEAPAVPIDFLTVKW